MGTLWQDLRFGLRMLAKNPGFTAIAVLTLALGIGASAAIFSVIYGVLLRPLPYPKPDQIVQMWEVSANGHRMSFAEPNFEDTRNSAQSFDGLAEYASNVFSIAGGSEPTRSIGAVVSRDFFRVLGVLPVVGRGFTAEDAREGAAPSCWHTIRFSVSSACFRRASASRTEPNCGHRASFTPSRPPAAPRTTITW